MARIRAPGERDPLLEAAGPDLGALQELGGRARMRGAIRVSAARAGAEPAAIEGLEDDTVVELTLRGGVRFWLRYDQLKADLPATVTRGAAGAGDDTVDLPLILAGPPTRGGEADLAIEAVQAFEVDLAGMLGDAMGERAGSVIAQKFDDHMMEAPDLYRWTAAGTLDPIASEQLAGSDPILLFIHGTASSTAGSFGALRETERSTAWRRLSQHYGDRIVALEHRTLSVSPIENALALLRKLPDAASLHIVTHSRGGMVGELLCRAQRVDHAAPFDQLDLRRFGGSAYAEQQEGLKELSRRLQRQKPTVQRFVRVACPAAGTTLASGRLDRWLSLFTDLLDLTGLEASQTYRFVKGFLLAVVKTRTAPQKIPGLEAMMPGSPLTAVLNRPGLATTADLSVIAGDIEGEGLLARLALKAADWFYGGDHDLVVDTVAMYGGLARQDGARAFFDQGGGVSHFNYFRNARTVERLIAGLRRADGDDAGFAPLEPPKEIETRVYGRREGAPRPVVFVLPGIGGSHLAIKHDRVWIDLLDLAQGRFQDLALPPPREAEKVRLEALVADAYRRLVDRLSVDHEVVPFPYDWRLSLQDEAGRFADVLAERLAATVLPVRVIAHSMGGLVARLAFALRGPVWREFANRPGCRLLMLGVPTRGSFAIPRLLLAEERLVKYLALLDLEHSEQEVLEIAARFPGVLEQLPVDGALDFFATSTWARLHRAKRQGWVEPRAADLEQARQTRQLLDRAPLDAERMVYVAGVAAATVAGLEIEAERRVRFLATTRGDGRVPWDTGIPPGLQPWFVDAEHGALADHVPAFAAYLDLLETGSTPRLPNVPPPGVRAAAAAFELPPDRAEVFPDQPELAAAALGYRQVVRGPAPPKIQVRLVHGNLGFARCPVAVGHYVGDTLAGAERHLDWRLGGRLSRRRDLRLYPGPIESAEVVLDSLVEPPGAVIVGLGNVGELTPGDLRKSIAYAMRNYGLAAHEQGGGQDGQLGISTLLIGSGDGGIAIRDSVNATLEGVGEAHRALGRQGLSAIEFIELYEDRAIQAAHAIKAALKDQRLLQLFEFDGQVSQGEGGRRQAAPGADPSWWQRLTVKAEPDGALRFTALTDRARAEVSLIADQRVLVDRFVRRAVAQPTTAAGADHPGHTLFELLIPNRLKEHARSDLNLVLVLDHVTARYPWELLYDVARGEREPMAVRAGVIRQLDETHFRDRPLMATERKALVVGDPPSGMKAFPPLEGAKEEAERVARLLARGGFTVTERIRSDPESIVGALMADRYQMLHLAGHGDVDFLSYQGPVTGMVLGDGLFLTPATINQLPAVPEFVFINCCHLARVEAGAERRAESRFHELAANLATQFIKLGVRAVVAAGWAVDDGAAKLFAETLYDRLLSRATFGEAVREARHQTYLLHPHTNTWGAYQCYGDPAYVLGRSDGDTVRPPREDSFVHLREAIVAIDNIFQDAQTMAVREPVDLNRRLDAVLRLVPRRWQEDPELITCAGRCCGELGRLGEAIVFYTQAVEANTATTPIRTLEQLANLRSRYAVQRFATGEASAQEAEKQIRAAVDQLERLLALAGGKEVATTERLSLLGSCHKHLAQVVRTRRKRDSALANMAEWYQAAHQRALASRRKLDTYPLLNWQLAKVLAARRAGQPAPADLESWLGRAEEAATPADQAEPGFWKGITLADVALIRHLARDNLPARHADLIEAYLRPWRRGASPLKFASVLEHLDFISAVLDDAPAKTPAQRAALRSALRAVTDRLRQETAG